MQIGHTGLRQEANMRKICLYVMLILLFFPFISMQAAEKSKVEYLGTYSNQTNSNDEDPHFEGYILDLFREGDIVFGRFFFATGIEVPFIQIQDVVLNSNKNHLFFRAKMSLGREGWSRGKGTGEGRLTRDLIEFNGTITESAVTGTLTRKDGYDPHLPGQNESVTLKRVKKEWSGDPIGSSYAKWAAEPWNNPPPTEW